MQQFQRQMYGLDIGYIQEYLVSRVKYWGWRSFQIVIVYYIFLCLLDSGLGFFNCYLHLLHKLIYCFQSGGLLPGFKAYMGSASSVKQEQSLLGRDIHIVVVLEFYHGQQVIPVILLLVDKQAQVLIELLINTLCLSISLQMPDCRRDQLYLQQLIEFLCE